MRYCFHVGIFRYLNHHINYVLGPNAMDCCTSNVTDSFNRITCQKVSKFSFYFLEVFIPLIIGLNKEDGE